MTVYFTIYKFVSGPIIISLFSYRRLVFLLIVTITYFAV
jgi:hypothetical protein